MITRFSLASFLDFNAFSRMASAFLFWSMIHFGVLLRSPSQAPHPGSKVGLSTSGSSSSMSLSFSFLNASSTSSPANARETNDFWSSNSVAAVVGKSLASSFISPPSSSTYVPLAMAFFFCFSFSAFSAM